MRHCPASSSISHPFGKISDSSNHKCKQKPLLSRLSGPDPHRVVEGLRQLATKFRSADGAFVTVVVQVRTQAEFGERSLYCSNGTTPFKNTPEAQRAYDAVVTSKEPLVPVEPGRRHRNEGFPLVIGPVQS